MVAGVGESGKGSAIPSGSWWLIRTRGADGFWLVPWGVGIRRYVSVSRGRRRRRALALGPAAECVVHLLEPPVRRVAHSEVEGHRNEQPPEPLGLDEAYPTRRERSDLEPVASVNEAR